MGLIPDTISVEATALVDWFWRRAGGGQEFPRDVVAAASWVLPLCVVELPGLTISSVGDWLREREIPVPDLPPRPLHACLVARGGEGVLLLDANDAADERRYSAAHEIGHFLRDHLLPRERHFRRCGAGALAVLDGERAASLDERLDALLSETSLQPWTHLLDRDAGGDVRSERVAAAEQAADGLAIELLAPIVEVEHRFSTLLVRNTPTTRSMLGERLVTEFGLPNSIARAYAGWILRRQASTQPLRHWLEGNVDRGPQPNLSTRRRTWMVRTEQRKPET
jgi:hypothetical protein